jgi:hypothetical protein
MDQIAIAPNKEVSLVEVAEKAFSPELTACERILMDMPPVDCPLEHRFTDGLYTRQIFMPYGSVVASKIHKTEHQFIISKGDCSVWSKETGWVRYQAPYHGITKPGARRLLVMHEDTVWTTFHPNPENIQDLEELEARLVLPHKLGELGFEPDDMLTYTNNASIEEDIKNKELIS